MEQIQAVQGPWLEGLCNYLDGSLTASESFPSFLLLLSICGSPHRAKDHV